MSRESATPSPQEMALTEDDAAESWAAEVTDAYALGQQHIGKLTAGFKAGARWQRLRAVSGVTADAIAAAVTARIFDMGREYEADCHRIEFKVHYQGNEVGVGGLAKAPFHRYVREAVAEALASGPAEKEGWFPIDTIPAGRSAIVVQQLPESCWRYVFAEWRVREDGCEGLFDTEGHEVVGASHWMPCPEWKPTLSASETNGREG